MRQVVVIALFATLVASLIASADAHAFDRGGTASDCFRDNSPSAELVVSATVQVGQVLTISGRGFAPACTMRLVLQPPPAVFESSHPRGDGWLMGQATAGAAGDFQFSITVPATYTSMDGAEVTVLPGKYDIYDGSNSSPAFTQTDVVKAAGLPSSGGDPPASRISTVANIAGALVGIVLIGFAVGVLAIYAVGHRRHT